MRAFYTIHPLILTNLPHLFCSALQVLTNWATLQLSDSMSDPKAGSAAMWLQAAGQWVALLLYCWSLVAPAVFPNRDFGPGP